METVYREVAAGTAFKKETGGGTILNTGNGASVSLTLSMAAVVGGVIGDYVACTDVGTLVIPDEDSVEWPLERFGPGFYKLTAASGTPTLTLAFYQ